MKRIIIIAVIAVALAAAAVLFIIGKNDVVSADVTMDISQVTVDKFSSQDERDAAIMANRQKIAETNVVMVLNDGSVSTVADKSLTQDERDMAVRIDKENRIAVMLSELDKVNSARVTITADNLSVTAVLDISTELSQDETDAVLKLIMLSLDSIEKEDILITDQNSNVIYPVSE